MKTTRYQIAIRSLAGCLLFASMATSAFAQVHHSGERSDDFTMVPRVMSRLPETTCPVGQIAMGSSCVSLPATPASQTTAWTALVPTETRCGIVNDGAWISYTGSSVRQVLDSRNFCITMNGNGAGSVSGYNYNDLYFNGRVSTFATPGAVGTGPYMNNPNAAIYTDIAAYGYGTLVLSPTFAGNTVAGWTIGIQANPPPVCSNPHLC